MFLFPGIKRRLHVLPGPARVIGSPVQVMWQTKHVASMSASGQSALALWDLEGLGKPVCSGERKSSVLHKYHKPRSFELSPASVTQAVVAILLPPSLCLGQAMLPWLVMDAGGGGLLGLFPIACWASFVSVFSKPHQVSSATKP